MKTLPITFRFQQDGHEIVKTFTADTITIGRSPTVNFLLDHESVWRVHATVQHSGGIFFVSDGGTAGGTYVNDQRVNRAPLKTGDVLRIGRFPLEVQIGTAARSETVASDLPEDEPTMSAKPTNALSRLVDLVQQATHELIPTRRYYCEQCLLLYGRIVETAQTCPECGSGWRLNRGQARHVVSLKLQHYWRLAKLLGIRK